MCGIFFSVGFKSLSPAVIDSVTHRGPDDRGWNEFTSPNGPVVMAHRRLAIVDLSPDGHQPMSTEEKRFWITYNGEIYNYIEIKKLLEELGHNFRTKTDTEVLLKSYLQWGQDCLNKFNGMFAFVIWDDKEKKVFVARDRFGVKPLYYYRQGNKIAFASEIKQIIDLPNFQRKINTDHLLLLIINGHDPLSHSTLFQNVYHVEPGKFISSNLEHFQENFWYEPHPKKNINRHYQEEFLEIFEDAIRKRLIADVPIGSLLSGGLDSSAIVCMISKLGNIEGKYKNIETFTSWSSDPLVNEKAYSDAVIAKTGITNHLAEINDDALQADIEDIIYHQEEPFLSTSVHSEWNIYKNISRRTKLKVVLDGQGSDELICGYLFMIPQILTHYIKIGSYYSAFKELLYTSFNHKDIGLKTLVIDTLCKTCPGTISFIQKFRGKKYFVSDEEIFNNFQDYSTYLIRRSIGSQLRWQDRSSMAFSIESRQPFLDFRLVEFLLALPLKEKFCNGTTKVIIRNSLKGILPEIVRNRRSKFGFPSPQKTLVKRLDKNYFHDYYQIGVNLLKGLYSPNKIEFFQNRHSAPNQGQFFIFSIGLWAKKFQFH